MNAPTRSPTVCDWLEAAARRAPDQADLIRALRDLVAAERRDTVDPTECFDCADALTAAAEARMHAWNEPNVDTLGRP